MLKVEPILDIIETTLWSGKLANEKPLSIMLIASVGDGKSEMLRKAYKAPKITTEWIALLDKNGEPIVGKDNKPKMVREQEVEHIGSVLYTTDTTPFVLHHRYGNLLTSGQIKHIVIPDFLSILTKSRDTMPDTIRFYNCLIEEGIIRIESRFSDFIVEKPVQIGLITAVSKQDYDTRSQAQGWGALGFVSRILPVSYSYSLASKKTILTSVFLREYHNETSFKLDLPTQPVDVELPKEFLSAVTNLAYKIKDATDALGARRLKQVMTFLMAIALKNGRDIVKKEDIDKVIEYQKFFNSDCKVEL